MSEIFTAKDAKDAASTVRAGLAMAGNPAPKCTSWLGHKFEARYSITNPALRDLIARAVTIAQVYPQSMQDKEYVCDICVRCGFVVERKPDKSSN